MIAVAPADSSPAIDNHLGVQRANLTHHVFQHLVAPDSQRFFGRLRKSEVWRAREPQMDSVAARRGKQLRGADASELWCLLRPERVLPTLAAGERQKGDVGMEPSRQIRQQAGRFVIRVRGNVENPRGHARVVNRFNSFGKARPGSRRGGKLRRSRRGENAHKRTNAGKASKRAEKASHYFASAKNPR